MTETIVHRYPTADATAVAAADAAIERILEVQGSRERVDIAITGGTVGIKTLACWAAHSKRDEIDYSRLHFWWGDERFVASDSPDRNFVQAWDALLQFLPIDNANLHQFPAADSGLSLAQAADIFAAHWREQAPNIEFGFMGMGPDGHIASLFPGKPVPAAGDSIALESDSPKPPAQRLTLTYEAINGFQEIWFTVAGADKAHAVEVAFSETPERLPVGRVQARERNVWFIDDAAAAAL